MPGLGQFPFVGHVKLAWSEIRASLWFVPGTMAALGMALALVMLRLDAWVSTTWMEDVGWIYTRSAGGARDLLSTVAASMITVAGLAFSILIVALQLASSQFGPRVLRNFMRDRGSQTVLGTFIATYLYCLMIMRTISDDSNDEPRLAVSFGVVLAVASLAVLIYFLHHAAASIHAPNVITAVARDLEQAIDRMYPAGIGEPEAHPTSAMSSVVGDDHCLVRSEQAGYVQHVDADGLLAVADRSDLKVELLRRPGQFVWRGEPLLAVAPPARVSDSVAQSARRAFLVGGRRTPEQDVEFIFEQISQIALRALSSSFNDPYTAVACVDQIGAALDRLLQRREPSPVRLGRDGVPRVIAHALPIARLIDAAVMPIVDAARGHDIVARQLAVMLDRLAARAATAEARDALLELVRQLRADSGQLHAPRARAEVERYCRRALHALGEA